MRLYEFDKNSRNNVDESNVDQNNAEYAKTNYPQANDDTMYTNNTFGDNLAYQNFASKQHTAQQNRVNNASKNADYNATITAQSQHTAPKYGTQEEWNQWIRTGGLEYAREMDLQLKRRKDDAGSSIDYAERQAYIRSQNKISQNK